MKTFQKLMLVAAMLLSTTFAKTRKLEDIVHVIPYTELSSEMARAFLTGTQPNLAIEFREGMRLPLNFVYRQKIFSAGFAPNFTVEIKQSCYVRQVGTKAYMSSDLMNWEKASSFLGNSAASVEINNSADSAIRIPVSD